MISNKHHQILSADVWNQSLKISPWSLRQERWSNRNCPATPSPSHWTMNHKPCRGPSVNQTDFISHLSSYLIISLGEPPLYPHLIDPNLPAFDNFEDFRAYAPTADPRGSSDVTYFPASVPRRPLGQAERWQGATRDC
jgi:hypothetical protein